MIGTILAVIFFVIIIISCCASDSKSSNSNTTTIKTVSHSNRGNTYYPRDSYSECPACGAPYYDGYCEECGYPDINQGWLGE